jgi:hypothetical protein
MTRKKSMGRPRKKGGSSSQKALRSYWRKAQVKHRAKKKRRKS